MENKKENTVIEKSMKHGLFSIPKFAKEYESNYEEMLNNNGVSDLTFLECTNEMIIYNLNAWRCEYLETINVSQTKGMQLLEYYETTYKNYKDKKIHIHCPYVYVENANIITRYTFGEYGELDFMPNSEYSDNEHAYLTLSDNDKIKVVVNITPANKFYEPDQDNTNNNHNRNTYLMIDGNGYYKIGKSFNPKARESTLQSENPTIKLIAICDNDVEKELHYEYSEYRKRGEWFRLKNSQIKDIVVNWNFTLIRNQGSSD